MTYINNIFWTFRRHIFRFKPPQNYCMHSFSKLFKTYIFRPIVSIFSSLSITVVYHRIRVNICSHVILNIQSITHTIVRKLLKFRGLIYQENTSKIEFQTLTICASI